MKMKLWIYETNIFELRNEEINVKKILAVINATCWDSNPDLCDIDIDIGKPDLFGLFFSQLHKLR